MTPKNPADGQYQQYEHAVYTLEDCTDDYLFFFDIEKDYFSISQSVLNNYALPGQQFYNARKTLESLVLEKDLPEVVNGIIEVTNGIRESFNMDFRMHTRDNNLNWVNCRGKRVKGEGRSSHLIGRFTELGEKRRADNITGFRTQLLFERDYREHITDNMGKPGYVMRIGIDNFREINEKYGQDMGDEVLRALSKSLMAVIPANVRIYRMEGDKFTVFYNDGAYLNESVVEIVERIRRQVEQQTREDSYKIFYTISIGVVRIPTDAISYEDMFKKSEYSLNCAKKMGKNALYFFDEGEYTEYIRQINIQEELRKSVADNFAGFYMVYQPIYDLNNNRVAGAEALLRWNNDRYGSMSPTQFIPLLEESGLIIPVGQYVYKTAIDQCIEWQNCMPDFVIHINVSYIQLKKSEIINDIAEYVNSRNIDPKKVVIEITESGEIESNGVVRNKVDNITINGESLAIDDFGTGYSNLRYLKELKVDTLKIDRAFVIDSTSRSFDFNLIKHFTELAHSVNMKICLEGVETEEQLNVLSSINPDYIQGFYFGRPERPEVFFHNFIDKKRTV